MNTASATELRGRCGPGRRKLVSKQRRGIVCGVFSSALYCDFESEILLFHSCAYGEVPFGAALDDVKSFLAACQASAGDTITLQPDGFSLGGKNYILCQTAAGIPRPSGHILPPDPSRLAAIYAFVRENGLAARHAVLAGNRSCGQKARFRRWKAPFAWETPPQHAKPHGA